MYRNCKPNTAFFKNVCSELEERLGLFQPRAGIFLQCGALEKFSICVQFTMGGWLLFVLAFLFSQPVSKKYQHQQAECQKYFSCWTYPNFFLMLLMTRVCVRPPAIQSVLNGCFFFNPRKIQCVQTD